MRTCLIVAVLATSSTAARAGGLQEPFFVPFDMFSPPRHAHVILTVKQGRIYQAVFAVEAAPGREQALSAFARKLWAPGGYVVLPMPAHIRIARADTGDIVADQATPSETLYASSPRSLSFRLAAVRLEKGDYVVDVDSAGALAPVDGLVSSFGMFVRRL
jgi:hypothetical protein